MKSWRVRTTATGALLALGGTLAGSPLGGGPAAGAGDTTSPTVRLDAWAHPRVGSQVFIDHEEPYWQAELLLRWRTSDPSRICSQQVAWQGYEQIGGEVDPVLGRDTEYYRVAPGARRFGFSTDSANWDRIQDRFVVRSTDCAGNTGTSEIATVSFGSREDGSSAIDYHGRWAVSRSEEATGGTTHWTRRPGAGFSTTVNGSDGPVALVMATGPGHGRADVYVDGRLRRTVDTHVRRARPRVIVWEGIVAGGPHTLSVVNKGTPGHPRIDLDTVITRSGAQRVMAG